MFCVLRNIKWCINWQAVSVTLLYIFGPKNCYNNIPSVYVGFHLSILAKVLLLCMPQQRFYVLTKHFYHFIIFIKHVIFKLSQSQAVPRSDLQNKSWFNWKHYITFIYNYIYKIQTDNRKSLTASQLKPVWRGK